MTVGIGYDAHRLVRGRPLMVGGVHVPFDSGLDGHSDADVLVHAIIDALLGAVGDGDIGEHFPDTDERFRGASSIELLRETSVIIYSKQFEIVNIDSVVCAEAPKLAPFRSEMRRNIARALNVSPERVSVKMKTEEGMGFTGSGEGMSARAVCLVRKRAKYYHI